MIQHLDQSASRRSPVGPAMADTVRPTVYHRPAKRAKLVSELRAPDASHWRVSQLVNFGGRTSHKNFTHL